MNANVSSGKTTGSNTNATSYGEFGSEGADIALRTFYDAVSTLVSTEAEWLREVFPDIKIILLPSLLCESLATLKDPTPRANVFIHPSVADAVAAADALGDRLFSVAEIAVSAAAGVADILIPVVSENDGELGVDDGEMAGIGKETYEDHDQPKELLSSESQSGDVNGNGENVTTGSDKSRPGTASQNKDEDKEKEAMVNAVSAILMPWRMFWDVSTQVAIRQGRSRAEAIQFSSSSINREKMVSLGDIARDVEECSHEASIALDHVAGTITRRTCGIGIVAMKQASATICNVVSDRITKVLPKSQTLLSAAASANAYGTGTEAEDEWTRLGGALRLLVATSALKRAWDMRKDAAFAVAIGAATPILEAAGAVSSCNEGASPHQHKYRRVRQLIAHVKAGQRAEAGMVWELGRDADLAQRVVSEFENIQMQSGGSGGAGNGMGASSSHRSVSASKVAIGSKSSSHASASALNNATGSIGNKDFERVVSAVHQVVYDTMFVGVVSRFDTFGKQGLWSVGSDGGAGNNSSVGGSVSSVGNDNSNSLIGSITSSSVAGTDSSTLMGSSDMDLAMAGLSTSPLRYATELADYLMAIPQQLEPFVPDDEDDARFATPRSAFQFCRSGDHPDIKGGSNKMPGPAAASSPAQDEEDVEEGVERDIMDEEDMSFAGMWITVLAMGTMELYVEKICSVVRLSEAGAKQLAIDADYLCNVMGSLGVAPTKDMALVCRLLEAKPDANVFAEIAAEYAVNATHYRKLVRRVAAVRGVNVTL